MCAVKKAGVNLMKYSMNQTLLILKITRRILILFAFAVALSLGTQIQAATPKEYNPLLEKLGSTQDSYSLSPTLMPLDELVLSDLLGVQTISPSNLLQGGTTVRNAGAAIVRMKIEWRGLSGNLIPVYPVDYDWTSFDDALQLASSLGLRVLVNLGANPYWAADFNRGPINKVPLDRFTEYVQAVVGRYSSPPYNVEYWEFYNEPDVVSFWVGEEYRAAFGDHPADYVQTLQLGYNTVKSINPDATVFMGGIAHDGFTDEGGPFNRDFLGDILALGAGNYFDVMNFHYYPAYDARWEGLTSKPALIGKAEVIMGILQNNGVQKPMVCTELGLSSSPTYGGSDDLQSQAVIKLFSRTIAADLQFGIWYNISDYGPSDPFSYHGLLDSSYQPKPSLSAFSTLASFLDSHFFMRTFGSTEWGGTSIEGYAFRHNFGTEETAVIWTQDGSTQTITLPPDVTSVEDKYGNPVSYGSTISLDGDPRFITYSLSRVFLPLIGK